MDETAHWAAASEGKLVKGHWCPMNFWALPTDVFLWRLSVFWLVQQAFWLSFTQLAQLARGFHVLPLCSLFFPSQILLATLRVRLSEEKADVSSCLKRAACYSRETNIYIFLDESSVREGTPKKNKLQHLYCFSVRGSQGFCAPNKWKVAVMYMLSITPAL